MSVPGGRSRSGPGPGLVVVAGRGLAGSGDSGFFLSVTHCDSVTERPARLEISAFLRCRRAAGLRLATLVTFLAAACYGGLVWCGVG